MRSNKYLFGVALLLASATPNPASAEPAALPRSSHLAGEELRKAFSGRTFRISTPVGILAVSFRANGTMSGTASAQPASFNSSPASEKDIGRWQIQDDRLCQRWRNWLSGETFCVHISRTGETFHWRSAEGYSGEARLLR